MLVMTLSDAKPSVGCGLGTSGCLVYYFDGARNLTDVQIRTSMENVSRVKRVDEEMNVYKFRNDLRWDLTMDDKL